MNKQISTIIEKSSDDQIHFILSASTPDRVQDTIDVKAYEPATKIDKLPALFNHESDKPFGYWHKLRVVGDTLRGTLVTASTNLGKMIKQLIDDGVPLSSSIGFYGKGKPNKKGGTHFTELELLECSVVSIPCHTRAVQIAKSYDLTEYIDQQSSLADVDTSASALVDNLITRAKRAILSANKTLKGKKS